MSKNLERYVIKIPSINLPHLKEFETLSTSSKMVCSKMNDNMFSQTVFQQITWNSEKGPKFRIDDLQMHLHYHWLAAKR